MAGEQPLFFFTFGGASWQILYLCGVGPQKTMLLGKPGQELFNALI